MSISYVSREYQQKPAYNIVSRFLPRRSSERGIRLRIDRDGDNSRFPLPYTSDGLVKEKLARLVKVENPNVYIPACRSGKSHGSGIANDGTSDGISIGHDVKGMLAVFR